MASPPRRKLFAPVVSILGLMSLSFLSGAAVMHFELPLSNFLENAFGGAHAWLEQKKAPPRLSNLGLPPVIFEVDIPAKTFDGFTLYTTRQDTKALLINMRGDVIHRWEAPFSKVWPNPSHVPQDPVSDYFFSCHLFANGDLLVVYQADDITPYGYGLAKLDKDSNVLWSYAKNVHHDVDVGEDGTIYALTQKVVKEVPKGLEFIPTPCLVDYLELLSPEGKELQEIPILEAFRDSPYRDMLTSLGKAGRRNTTPDAVVPGNEPDKRDITHTNFVRVLSQKLAPKFPMFKAGQVLISVRHLDTVAVLDLESRSVVWAVRGPWKAQHDAQFLDNGRLLIFDNLGSPDWSRVLEYDPQAEAVRWSYPGKDNVSFINTFRGMSQRLPNGNTLIVNSDLGNLLEVTPSKELAWLCCCRVPVFFARRYGPKQVPFLDAAQQRARP